VCLAGLALIANIVIAVLFTLLLGMAAGIAWVTGYTLLGLEVADDVRGRTFAFVQNSARVVLIGVMALAPGLAALFGERSYRIGQHVLIRYNGAALTLLVASVIAVLIGLISYRTMNDGRSTPLLDDIVSAWRSRPTSTAPEHEITPYPGRKNQPDHPAGRVATQRPGADRRHHPRTGGHRTGVHPAPGAAARW
jgi:dTMP kinase